MSEACSHSCEGCTGCGVPYAETREFPEIVTLTEENFNREVYDDPAIAVIDFWAEWCGPCRMMAPVFEQLHGEEPHVKFCRVNVDDEPRLAELFGIESIPTIVVMQDRHALSGAVGVRTLDELREMLGKCKKA